MRDCTLEATVDRVDDPDRVAVLGRAEEGKQSGVRSYAVTVGDPPFPPDHKWRGIKKTNQVHVQGLLVKDYAFNSNLHLAIEALR